MRLRESGAANQEVIISAGNEPLVRQTPPVAKEKTAALSVMAERIPRIAKLLALAVRFEELLRNGTVKDYADLAQLGGISRSRITQVMNLRQLAPVLQERILQLTGEPSEGPWNERALRQIGSIVDWREQIARFDQISTAPRDR
jgi:hypothetical protein